MEVRMAWFVAIAIRVDIVDNGRVSLFQRVQNEYITVPKTQEKAAGPGTAGTILID